ncbi:MAG: hypothetical protein CMI54_02695 [Parcubacteria group bacterium]|jgi:hypothetical protein|nr:hypothetical protein [Parcubacteria group bacterium]|tara:strand:+ start:3462 stop:4217 length:756 start_codon:yes stop_codon:yes gene_type:complete
MILDNIVTELDDNCAALSSAVAAHTVTTLSADAMAVLATLLDSTVSDRLYALRLPEKPVYPNIVYHPVSSKPLGVDGFELLRTETFVLEIREEGHDGFNDLITLLNTIQAAVITYTDAGNIGAMEVIDSRIEFEDEQLTYVAFLQVEVTFLNAASQATNAAYVYLINASAGESIVNTFKNQVVRESFAITLVCLSSNTETLRGQVEDCLLGFQPVADGFQMEYASGNQVGVFGHIEVWREVYSLKRIIKNY